MFYFIGEKVGSVHITVISAVLRNKLHQSHFRYLLTTSTDQTTRAHAPWKRTAETSSPPSSRTWREIARPQVHGHDLVCLTSLPGHRFASGADEKIVRTFEATNTFLGNLASISGISLAPGELDKAQGASVPSLGLSNKAVFEGQADNANPEERHVKDNLPDFYFTPEQFDRPPPEESLMQNALWPELQKLYGHGFEIFSLAADGRGSDADGRGPLIASACKAAKAEHAEVLLWNAETWKIVQRLKGHGLTVTQMAFSPDDRRLLTVSRDRTWCLYERTESSFEMIAHTDKKTALHSRLIWACDWSMHSKYFATVSRDKKVAIWTETGVDSNSSLGKFGLACKQPLTLNSSATAVAFAPIDNMNILAIGCESGHIFLYKWDENDHEQEWKLISELKSNEAHHKTVKRLKFRPGNHADGNLILASASSDHCVKLYELEM